MKKYLIFRTDRVEFFYFSLKLIKIIKTNEPNSEITVIASKKNYKYIKTFSDVDEIIPNNLFSKIKLIFNLKKYVDAIVVHDGKNRSKFISFFLNLKRAICITNLMTQIEIIKACKVDLKFLINV